MNLKVMRGSLRSAFSSWGSHMLVYAAVSSSVSESPREAFQMQIPGPFTLEILIHQVWGGS